MRWDGLAYASDILYGLTIMLSPEERYKARFLNNADFVELIKASRSTGSFSFRTLSLNSEEIVLNWDKDRITFLFPRILNNIGDKSIYMSWSMAARHIRYELMTEERIRRDQEEKNMAINLADRMAKRKTAFQAEENRLAAAEILQTAASRPITQLDINAIIPFNDYGKGQPFHIQEQKVLAIKKSIEDIGFLQPIIVREIPEGYRTSSSTVKYEVLSGHHRLLAAQKIASEGKEISIPSIIYSEGEVDNETAYAIVAESNTPSSEPLPSERSEIFARYLKMNRLKGKGEQEKVAELLIKFSIPKKTFYRYLNLQKLIPQLRKAVDNRVINLALYEKLPPAFDASEQAAIASYIEDYDIKKISSKDISKLLVWRESNEEQLTADIVYEILNSEPSAQENEEEEEATPNDIYQKIHDAFPGTMVCAMSNKELDDLILRRIQSFLAEHGEEGV